VIKSYKFPPSKYFSFPKLFSFLLQLHFYFLVFFFYYFKSFCLAPTLVGVRIFGLIRFWTKISNQTEIIFFQVFKPNRTENRFEPTMFVRFFSLPNQFKPKIIFGFFHLSYFFKDSIFVLFLISQICAFCAYFLRNFLFLNKYGSFLNWLDIHDIQKFNPDFLLVRSLPKN